MEGINNKILDKLRKIKVLADNAGTEGEAFTAAAMLDQLLMKHKLEMTDVEWDAEIKDEPVEVYPVGGGVTYGGEANGWKFTYKDYPDIEIKRKRLEWSENLARIISRAYGCDWLLVTGSSRITFVGRKSNVAIVEYMYVTMYRVIETLSWKEYKTARNTTKWEQIKDFPKEMRSTIPVDYSELEGFRSAWINGFVGRVREMLEEMKAKEQDETNSSGTALMRINSDAIATGKYMDDRFGNSKGASSLNGSSSWNAAGRAAGRAKANEVGMTAKGMGASGPKKQLG